MPIVGRLDQYASTLALEFDETTANTPRITGLGTYYASEFSENVGIATTMFANIFAPYDPVYDDFGGTLFGPGQGRYMRQNTDKSVIVYNEIDEVTDFYGRGIVVRDGLVLDLDAGIRDSYSGSGTTWTNLISTGNKGTLTNGPTYGTAKGGEIVFNGSNQYTQLTSQSLSSVDFSVEVWFFATKAVSLSQILYTSYNLPNGAQANTFILHITSGKLYINNGNSSFASNANISNNTWYHAVATYTASGTTPRLYINGILDSSGSFAISSGASSNFIGGSPGDNNIGTWWFGGSIPIVRAYRTKALSAAEVSQNYNALRNRFGL